MEASVITLPDGGEVDLRLDVDDGRIVVSAADERGNIIGHASVVLVGDPSRPQPSWIEVTPAHRRRGVGAAMLVALAGAARRNGVTALSWRHPADDLAVRRLARAGGAFCARRTDHGHARTTVFVPSAPRAA